MPIVKKMFKIGIHFCGANAHKFDWMMKVSKLSEINLNSVSWRVKIIIIIN